MCENLKKWESLGLLDKTNDNRKEFVSNSLELLVSYLNHIYDESNDGKYESIMFPIVTRIGNSIDFGINDFINIINEVRSEFVNDNNSEDMELKFVENFCEKKINQLKKYK